MRILPFLTFVRALILANIILILSFGRAVFMTDPEWRGSSMSLGVFLGPIFGAVLFILAILAIVFRQSPRTIERVASISLPFATATIGVVAGTLYPW